MIKEFQIINFKAFTESANIPIKPITLLFGSNSSGKSSIFQSLLILKQTLEEKHNRHITLLPKGNLTDLGSFRDFISNHDVNRSFSFCATLNPYSIEDAADYLMPEFWGPNYETHEYIELLDKSAYNETIGVNISFSLDQESSNVLVSYIDLYIGDDPYPIITYKKIGWGTSDYKFKGNFNHKFWKKYWEICVAKNPKDIEEIIQEKKDSIEKFKEAFAAMSEEEKKEFKNELFTIKGEEDSTKTFPEIQDSIKRDETNCDIKDKLKHLKGYEQAIETYKSLYKNNKIGLVGFLPRTLNKLPYAHIVEEIPSNDQEARDVSLFLLAAVPFIEHFFDKLIYIAPLREYPERYYIYGGSQAQYVGLSGKMVPDILFNDQELLSKVNEEFKRFGSDYELKVTRLSSEGIEIGEVFTLHLKNKITGVTSSLRDVGFGFSQFLPIIIQSILSKEKTLLIEQPELHLHPALQAELGDLFINSALSEQKNRFLIETHSEHLILRLLRRIRETEDGELPEGTIPITPDDLCVLYVQPSENGSEVIHIPVSKDGEFERPWPKGFFEEREDELLY